MREFTRWVRELAGRFEMHLEPVIQDEVLAFLNSPSAYDGAPVKRIDTHAASVFLSGRRALKIKRAVKFPFLDYSTLERRKQACLAELEVNRRFAPQLYVGLCRITREKDGELKIAGRGEVVEWAVEMLRFDENLTLDAYAAKNPISMEMANEIARQLADAHRDAPKQEPDAWLAALERFIAQNNDLFRSHPLLFGPDRVASLLQNTLWALGKVKPLIVKRAQVNLLVQGHGDLHLGNIALIHGAPVIFDAIEFDPLVAAGDVLYDLAFLLMDLVEKRQTMAANAALNGYLQGSAHAENYEGLILLPVFMSIRSAIRAMVTAAKFDRHELATDSAAAKRYFELAEYFLTPEPPMLVAIGGLSGTGKSHLARNLAPFLMPFAGAVVIRSDVERKRLFGVSETTRLQQFAYTPEATARVYGIVMDKARRVLEAGRSVVLDAVFVRSNERDAARRISDDLGVKFNGLFLVTDLKARLSRIAGRISDASDADSSVAEAQELYGVEGIDWAEIDASGAPAQTLALAMSAVGYSSTDRQSELQNDSN